MIGNYARAYSFGLYINFNLLVFVRALVNLVAVQERRAEVV
jgi:hypothetical protein